QTRCTHSTRISRGYSRWVRWWHPCGDGVGRYGMDFASWSEPFQVTGLYLSYPPTVIRSEFVLQRVMVFAEAGQVSGSRFSAVLPVDRVVLFAALRRSGAAGESAVLIAGVDELTQRGGRNVGVGRDRHSRHGVREDAGPGGCSCCEPQ